MPNALEENLKEQYSANRRKIDVLYGNIQSVRRRMCTILEDTQDLEDTSLLRKKAMILQEVGKNTCESLQKAMIDVQEQQAKIVKENPHIRFYY